MIDENAFNKPVLLTDQIEKLYVTCFEIGFSELTFKTAAKLAASIADLTDEHFIASFDAGESVLIIRSGFPNRALSFRIIGSSINVMVPKKNIDISYGQSVPQAVLKNTLETTED